MTEDEARTKRCCGPEGTGIPGDKGRLCVGPECMAWHHFVDKDTMQDSGYCGLARK